MKGTLTEHEKTVADRVLDEESARREHLVVSLTGAHAYGFPSPD
ncbi:nucleotidyltransferase domain-containing protein, partial [Myxococcus fulvus]